MPWYRHCWPAPMFSPALRRLADALESCGGRNSLEGKMIIIPWYLSLALLSGSETRRRERVLTLLEPGRVSVLQWLTLQTMMMWQKTVRTPEMQALPVLGWILGVIRNILGMPGPSPPVTKGNIELQFNINSGVGFIYWNQNNSVLSEGHQKIQTFKGFHPSCLLRYTLPKY